MAVSGVRDLFGVIRSIGGPKEALLRIFRIAALMPGKFVGKDAIGNEYYENNSRIFSRNRFVLYKDFWDFEGTQVAPEWHPWLHYMTDDVPTSSNTPKQGWQLEHSVQLLKDNRDYVPYSTTKPKVEAWSPKQ
eukprot:m.226680 g.226680  ORF g.226680 m.226680 type:complete len:133 (-) comp17009_c0_seq1:20-418(-)